MTLEPEAAWWEQVPVALLRVDLEARCRAANARARSLLGVAAPGASWIDAVHDDDRERIRAEWQAAAPRARVSFEFRARGDGARLLAEADPPDESGRLLSVTDVTALRPPASVDGSGQGTMNVLVEALDAISEGFAYFDADDRLVLHNRKHRDLFPSYAEALVPGVLFEELLRVQLSNIRLEIAVGREDEYIRQRVAEHRNPGPPREQVWEDGRVIRLSEYRTASGGVVSIRADITELKRAEAEVRHLNETLERRVEERTKALHEARDELVRKERLATLGQLTATVNHELRNPLGTMHNAFALLRRLPIGSDVRIQRAINQLGQGLERCRQIVDELLEFTRVRDVELVPVSFDRWVRQVVDELDSHAGVTLAFEPGLGETIARIDPHRLRRALVNLVENAFQSIDEASGHRGTGTVVVATGRAGERLWLTVSDDGPGIAEDDLERIFDPLISTRLHGFGLGLPTVRQILELHGGIVTAESVVGQGATFHLELPAAL